MGGGCLEDACDWPGAKHVTITCNCRSYQSLTLFDDLLARHQLEALSLFEFQNSRKHMHSLPQTIIHIDLYARTLHCEILMFGVRFISTLHPVSLIRTSDAVFIGRLIW
jgi:hypothetical protein